MLKTGSASTDEGKYEFSHGSPTHIKLILGGKGLPGAPQNHPGAGANMLVTFQKVSRCIEIMVFKIPCKHIYMLSIAVTGEKRPMVCQGLPPFYFIKKKKKSENYIYLLYVWTHCIYGGNRVVVSTHHRSWLGGAPGYRRVWQLNPFTL